MLSINALEIIAKKIDIRTFLVDKIVATRVKKLKTDL